MSSLSKPKSLIHGFKSVFFAIGNILSKESTGKLVMGSIFNFGPIIGVLTLVLHNVLARL